MIRRPLIYITSGFAAAIMVAYYIGVNFAILSSLLLMLFLIIFKKADTEFSKSILLLLIAYFTGSINFCGTALSYEKAVIPTGKNIEIRGKVLQVNKTQTVLDNEKIEIKVRVCEADEQQITEKINILASYYIDEEHEKGEEDIFPGDFVAVSGVSELPSGRRNPGCFDYALYLKSVEVKYIMKAENILVYERSGMKSLTGRMYMIRESFIKALDSAVGAQTSSMMAAVLFGEKEGMSEGVLEEFQKNGTAHILAVSGLHIGIIYGFISWLWRWKKGKRYFICVMLFFICYMAMASFAPSVVRAVFMIGLHMIAQISNRRYDLNSAAFFAALVMLVKNPMYLFNTGFQMSFLAVLTMALVIPVVKRFYSGMLLAGISIQLGLMPYIAYIFNYVSLGAVFVNVPIIFIAGIMVPVGLCAVAVMGISDGMFEVLSQILCGLCNMLTELNHVTAVDGITVFSVVSPDIRMVAAYYSVLILFLSEEGRLIILRKRKALIMLMIVAVIIFSSAFGQIGDREFRNAEVVFIDVGQGDCIHLRMDDGSNYLIDGGGNINYNVGKKILKPYLLKNGVKKLDGVFITHLHADHYKGIKELCREGMVGRIFLYEGSKVAAQKIIEETGLQQQDITYLYKGQTVNFASRDSVKVLWPENKSDREYLGMAEQENDENLSSLVFKVTIKGRSVLVTGDIDEECQKHIESVWKDEVKCDILKVAHHGSKYSYCNEFVERAAPEYAVFQVGKNNFGHPDKGVVENYLQKCIMVYRNDESGAVAFDFLPDGETKAMTVIKER